MLRRLALATILGLACTPPAKTPCPCHAPPAAELPLVPRPQSATVRCAQAFTIDRSTRIAGPKDVALQLAAWLGLPESSVGAAGGQAAIALVLENERPRDAAIEPVSIEEEKYVLDVDPSRGVTVRSRGRTGLFYGAQTIAQLAGARRIAATTPPLQAATTWSIPCVHLEDAPRYAFRAMHLDVARHFFDRSVVERYVDTLAFYKMNVFHWHLTDDQGFRLDLPSHPELKSADGAYSPADVKAVVEYARARGVTVVPEVEMPGHTRSVLAAHPELSCTGIRQETPRTWGIFDDVLCAGNEGSYTLMSEVLRDVASMFPSHYLHVGGDEVPPTRWNACPKCRAAMKAHGVDAVGLEHVFMERIFALLATLGRRPLVWDEALPPKPGPNAPIIVAWQSKERGQLAAERGFDAVFAPYLTTYLNFTNSPLRGGLEPGHQSGFRAWTSLHAFDPGSGPRVLGGEAALWTEFVTTQADVDTLLLPRLAAFAEALWTGPRPDHELVTRFKAQRPMLDASGIGYFIDPPIGTRPRTVLVDETTVTLKQPLLYPDGVIRYTRDGKTPTPDSPRYRDPLSITETMTLTTALFLPNGRASPPVRASFVKEAPRAPVPAGGAPTLSYYEGHFHRLADVAAAAPLVRLPVDALDLDGASRALGARMKRDHFALVFDAFIRVAEAGVYRFEIGADDGLRVEVAGSNVVEIDEELGPREADGDIALAPGIHPIRVTYFQGTEGRQLDVTIAGPSGKTALRDALAR